MEDAAKRVGVRLEGTLLPPHFVRSIFGGACGSWGAVGASGSAPEISAAPHCPGEAPLGTLGKRLGLSVTGTGPPTSQGDCKDHGQANGGILSWSWSRALMYAHGVH